MKSDIENLHKLLTLSIPKLDDVENGFLEIINKPHHENIVSNFYAYYLDKRNKTKFSSIFLDSLIELISQRTDKKLLLTNYEVKTEIKTESGKRIDIAIVDYNSNYCIIIENKIYHQLNNDLTDYWDHFKFPYQNKIGVVLSLNHLKIDMHIKGDFINITHNEWIDKILSKRIPFQAWNKNQVYLSDFFQTLKNLTSTLNMDDLAKFYFQHPSILASAEKAIKHGQNFLYEQQKLLAKRLDLTPYSEDQFEYVNYCDEENNRETFYTVIFDELVTGAFRIKILIEITGEDIDLIRKIETKLTGDIDFKKLNHKPEYFDGYVHFLYKDYTLTMSDVEKLADVIYEKIQFDFEPVMTKIFEILDNEKK